MMKPERSVPTSLERIFHAVCECGKAMCGDHEVGLDNNEKEVITFVHEAKS